MLLDNDKNNNKQHPKILQYWITNELSPCIKESIVKIITLDNNTSKKSNNKKKK